MPSIPPIAIAGPAGGMIAKVQAAAAGVPALAEKVPQAQATPPGEATALHPAFSGGAQTALLHLQEIAGGG